MPFKDMHFNYFLGWDVSKATLDYCVLDRQGQAVDRGNIANEVPTIRKFFKRLCTQLGAAACNILQCVENTGVYTHPLLLVMQRATDEAAPFLWREDALQIKLSSGRQKDKTDAGDALSIARYALRHQNDARAYTLPAKQLRQVRQLLQLRRSLLKGLTALEVSYRELKAYALYPLDTTGARIIRRQVQQMKKNLAELDARLTALIQEDEQMRRLYRITQSVPGMGPKNSLVVLALTELYQKIPTARACASYAGISPHTYQSGSSVRRGPRTSKASSAELKTAIHLGAMSLIKHDNLYRQLYDRLRAKGKAHLSAINAVRNKMLRVLYACIEKDTLYQKERHVSLHTP